MTDQWYQNRDKRTDKCEGVNASYKKATVNIIVSENANEYRIQLLIYFTLKILVKWCRSINLTMSDAENMVSKNQETFGSFLNREIKEVDPFCSFVINNEHGKEAEGIHLLIGKPVVEPNFDFVSINAAGWIAACGFNQHVEVADKAAMASFIGPAFAACLANAELFRCLIRERPYPYTKWYSLWTNEIYYTVPLDDAFGTDLLPTDFGRIHLVGCGAIGSSFSFLFPYSNCSARFLLIDPDEVEDHNTSSSLLFNFSHAATKQAKIELCRKYLEVSGIYAETFNDDYKNFEYDHVSEELNAADLILCFANENNIWSTIQYLYPPLCFHATTSKSWGIHIGRHIPLKDNCIMCTFEGLVKVNHPTICAAAEIVTTVESGAEEIHTAILPFLAPAAALVTLCELYKTCTGTVKNENTLIFNMQSPEGIFVREEGKFGGCYICKSQTESMYKQLNGKIKE